MAIWFRRGDKTWHKILVTSGSLLFRNLYWAAKISSLWPQIEVFYRPEWTKGRPHENEFWVYSNSEMNVRAEKVDEKNVKVLWFLPELWPINCPKTCIFAILCCPQQEASVFWSNLHICIWKVSLRTFKKWYC